MRSSLLLAALLALACATDPSPELALIYNASARHHAPDRNPIIVIPGILGSRLVDRDTGVTAWGAFDPQAADPDDPEGARVIALPIEEGQELEAMRDAVEPDGVLETVRIRLAGVPLEIQAYAGILQTLGAGGYRDEALGLAGEIDYGDDHFTCFQFDYDWRRDNVENARRLHDFIQEKRAYVRAQYRERFGVDVPDLRFDIVAHSMGGLLTRYFLRYGDQPLPAEGLPELSWAGASLVEKVILVGTPNSGSVSAFVNLLEGRRLAPVLPRYPAALLGTFPSTYQLLPRTRHQRVLWNGDTERPVDLMDASVWQAMEWGLAAPDQDAVLHRLLPDEPSAGRRRLLALRFLELALDRAERFHLALDRPARAPDGLDLILVAGDGLKTPQSIAVDDADGSLGPVQTGPGDGTVLRASVLLDEREGGVWKPRVVSPMDAHATLLLPDGHLALTRNDVFRDNVLFWLLEEPREPPPGTTSPD